MIRSVAIFALCSLASAFAADPSVKTPALAPKPVAVAKPVVTPVPPPAAPAAPSKTETLHFAVNWPSGLSLGEGELVSVNNGRGWTFSMTLDAALPAFPLAETADSRASSDLCSLELRKTGTRGKRTVKETTKFDAAKAMATRTTGGDGGKSEIRIGSCPKDALTFIQFARRELAAGRVPAAQQVYYGAGYQTRLQYTGTQKIRVGNEYVEADKLTGNVKGPASEFTLELYFARDPERKPLLVSIPVAVGKFTVEFER